MNYQNKKDFFRKMLTIYGRNPVLEALTNPDIKSYKLHLASSNKQSDFINQCLSLAEEKVIDVAYHDRKSLSHISKNAKQDQGIALDIMLENSINLEQVQQHSLKHLLLLDNVTNPQNVGMIIRNVAAGFLDAVLIPEKGCAELGPLVIKASAGTLFKAPIVRVSNTDTAMEALSKTHTITGLALGSSSTLYNIDMTKPRLFIVGNESKGLSHNTLRQCHECVHIPMNNDVESLNVAVTAALLAFHPDIVALKTNN